jgi:hypothetical protein
MTSDRADSLDAPNTVRERRMSQLAFERNIRGPTADSANRCRMALRFAQMRVPLSQLAPLAGPAKALVDAMFHATVNDSPTGSCLVGTASG